MANFFLREPGLLSYLEEELRMQMQMPIDKHAKKKFESAEHTYMYVLRT